MVVLIFQVTGGVKPGMMLLVVHLGVMVPPV